MNTEEPYITPEEAADYLNINKFTVHKWAIQRRIPSYKFGKSRRFKRSELNECMGKHKVKETK